MIYMDYNATTPCASEVLEVMLPYFREKFGNAASKIHPYGWVAEEGVELARKQVASLINGTPQEIIFTSGATEGCNLALKGVFEKYAAKGRHIITCHTEHKAVLDSCFHLEHQGAEVTYLPVASDGLINLTELKQAIRPDTLLISIMYANNETGVLQPIKEIGALAHEHKVLFFTDATQAVGKIPVDVQQDNIDLLALSGHKFYGPKGVGALFIRRRGPRVQLAPQIDGGGHEKGFRSGTLNVPGIVGLGKACTLAEQCLSTSVATSVQLKDKLEQALLGIEGSKINGHRDQRLPHVCNISFKGIRGERLLSRLNGQIAFSLGSACTSASQTPSHVLSAMKLSDERIKGSIRLSWGRYTTEKEVNEVIQEITHAVTALNAVIV